jgi:hypothetical protein
VIGELKDILICVESNPKVHQVIDIIVVDILEAYNLFLSRDWSQNLQGISPRIGLTHGFCEMEIQKR